MKQNGKATKRSAVKLMTVIGICAVLACTVDAFVTMPALASGDTKTIDGVTYTYFDADMFNYDYEDFNTREFLTVYNTDGTLKEDIVYPTVKPYRFSSGYLISRETINGVEYNKVYDKRTEDQKRVDLGAQVLTYLDDTVDPKLVLETTKEVRLGEGEDRGIIYPQEGWNIGHPYSYLENKEWKAGTTYSESKVEPILFYSNQTDGMFFKYNRDVLRNIGDINTVDESGLYSPINRWTGRCYNSAGWSSYDYIRHYQESRPNSNDFNMAKYPYLGIAADELDPDGNIQFNYPEGGIFSYDKDENGEEITDKWNEGKIVYTNVGVPFENTDDGYYTLDSSKYHTYFDVDKTDTKKNGESGAKLAVSKDRSVGVEVPSGEHNEHNREGFFPFNVPRSLNNNATPVDYGFGMKFVTDYYMTTNGKNIDGKDIVFKFSGDDDLWVYVDGKLALDIGGIHDPIKGEINFTQGTSTVYYGTENIVFKTDDLDDLLDADWDEPGVEHQLQVYYLERGGNISNCKISFNLPLERTVNMQAVKTWSDNAELHEDDSVSATLYRKVGESGTPESVGTQTLSEENEWQYTWETLPMTDSDGNYYTYYVEEAAVTGYTGEITAPITCGDSTVNGDTGTFTIVNSPVPYDVTVRYIDESGNAVKDTATAYDDAPFNSAYNVRSAGEGAKDYRDSIITKDGKKYVFIRRQSGDESGIIDGNKEIVYVYSLLTDPTVEKSVTPAASDITDKTAAHTLTYTIKVTNPNNFDIYDVTVTDPITAGTKADTVTPANDGTVSDSVITWSIAKIAKGGSASVSFTVAVDAETALPVITNKAYVNGFDVKPDGESGTTTETVTYPDDKRPNDDASAEIYKQPSIEKAIIENGSEVKANLVDMTTGASEYTVKYQLKVTNPNPVPMKAIKISDTIPAGLTYKANSGGTCTSGVVTWTISELNANSSRTLTFSAVITDASKARFTNAAEITRFAIDPNGDGKNLIDVTNADIQSNPVFTDVFTDQPAITKTADKETASVGEEITYTITVTNTSKKDVYDAVVTDALPDGLSFIEGTTASVSVTGSDKQPTVSAKDGVLTVNIPCLAANTGRAEIMLRTVVSEKKESYVNSAQISSYKITPAGTPKDDGIPSENVVVNGSPEPDITKTVDKAFARVGDVLHYTLTVTNSTQHKLFNAIVTDTLPAGVELVTGSVKVGGSTAAWNNGRFTVPVIEKNGTALIEFDARIVSGSSKTLTNSCTLVSGVLDTDDDNVNNNPTNTYNKSDDAVTKLISDPSITKAVSTLCAGKDEVIVYTLTVTNNDAEYTLHDVAVTDCVPNGLILAEDSLPAYAEYDSDTRVITWNVSSIAPSASAELEFSARVDDRSKAVWENIASVTGAAPDTDKDGGGDDRIEYPEGSVVSNKVSTDTKYDLVIEYREYDPASAATEYAGSEIKTAESKTGAKGADYNVNNADDIPGIIIDDDGIVWKKKLITPSSDALSGKYNSDKKIVVVYEQLDCPYTLSKQVSTDKINWRDSVCVEPGTTVWFRITVTNITNDAQYVVSRLSLSDKLKLNGTETAYPVGWETALSALSSANIVSGTPWVSSEMSYQIPADASADDIFLNTATLHDTKNKMPDLTDSAEVTVSPKPSLEITKTAPVREVAAGAKAAFVIVVKNTGNTTLTDIKVTDDTYDVEYNGTRFTRGSVITTIASLEAGESSLPMTVYYTVPETAASGDEFRNYATAKTLKADGTDDLKDTDDDYVTVYVPAPSGPQLTITKKVNGKELVSAEPGDYVTYTVVVTNNGSEEAKNVYVTDCMHEGDTLLTDDWAINKAWTIPSIAANSSYVIEDDEFRWQVPIASKDVRFDNTADVYTDEQTYKNNGEPEDSDTASVVVEGVYEIEVTKAADVSEVKPGDNAGYVIYVTNNSNAELENITVTESMKGEWGTLPKETLEDNDVKIVKNSDNTLTIDSLEAKDGVCLKFTGTIPETAADGESITNKVTASAPDPSGDDGDKVTDSAEAPVRVIDNILSIVKTAGCESAAAGSTVTYTVTVTNTGSRKLKDVVVTDDHSVRVTGETKTLKGGSATATISAAGSVDAAKYTGTVIGYFKELEPGECRVITVDYTIPAGAKSGEKIVNTATAVDSDSHSVKGSDDIMVIEKTVTQPQQNGTGKLEITKAANVSTAEVGSTVTYTIAVRNSGTADLHNVKVTDSLDVTYSGSKYAAGNIIKKFDTLAAGRTENLVVTYVIPQGYSGSLLTNIATADSDETEPVLANALVTVARPSIAISKTVSSQNVVAGQKVYYTLTVTNTGNVALTDVLVSDDSIGYSTTIPELGVGGQWTTPANQLFYVFDYGAAGGTSFRNNAKVEGGKVKGVSEFGSSGASGATIIANATATATVTLSGGQYITPDTGDAALQNNSYAVVASAAVISAAVCAAFIAAGVIKRRKASAGDTSAENA